MFSILNRALSWATTSFGNKFCLEKRSRLIRASDNRFYVKFTELEISLLILASSVHSIYNMNYRLWNSVIMTNYGSETVIPP